MSQCPIIILDCRLNSRIPRFHWPLYQIDDAQDKNDTRQDLRYSQSIQPPQGLNNNIAQQGSMNQMQGAVPQMQPQQDAERNRFIAELEFVQCLANPNYICFLAQHGYFKKPEFINYLSYLEVNHNNKTPYFHFRKIVILT